MINQRVVESLKPREVYLLFLCMGGSQEEFDLLPRPFSAGDEVLYEECRRLAKEFGEPVMADAVYQKPVAQDVFGMACAESAHDDVIEVGSEV